MGLSEFIIFKNNSDLLKYIINTLQWIYRNYLHQRLNRNIVLRPLNYL